MGRRAILAEDGSYAAKSSLSCSLISSENMQHSRNTDLLLGEIIRKVCNHDLVLGWDTVGRGATLTSLTGSTVGSRLGLLVLGLGSGGGGLVGGVSQGEDL